MSAGKSGGWIFKTLFIMVVAATLFSGLGAGLVYWHFSRGLPDIITASDYKPKLVTRVVATGGKEETVIGEFLIERRYLVPYESIPQDVVRAFISAEDDRFFEHPGFNVASIIRAQIANIRAGHAVQGGSTITQQLAKSLLLSAEKSYIRKIKELILATRIERYLTKQQILYLYLNQIYLGHGSYGVLAASRTYFRKELSALTIAEAALLAGLPQAPGKYSPLMNPSRAKERQRYVLRRMFENGYITQAQMSDAAAEPIKCFHDDNVNLKYSAYLVEHIRRYLVDKYGENAVYEQGLTVHVPTTPDLLIASSKSLREGLRTIDKRVGYRGPLKNIKSADEVEKFLREERLNLIDRKLQYQILLPDGRLDPIESMKIAGFHSDTSLLSSGELYQAIVTSVDDKKKVVGVMIGAIRAEMPLEKMKWAHPVHDEKTPSAWKMEPKLPSQVVKKGDVIWVKVEVDPAGLVTAALEQEPQVQGALVAVEAQTGFVLAMEGGYDHTQSEFNRATQAQRQAGSAFKPIIYSAALEKGFTPVSIIVDSPVVYEDSESGKWKPKNFEEKFYGDTTFRQALIKSRNIPTIKLVQAIQIPFLIDYSKRLGLNAQFTLDLSISLGSMSVSLMDITKVYALYPRLGRKVTPIFMTLVSDREGKVLEERKPQLLPIDVKIPPIVQTEPMPSSSIIAPANATPQAAIPMDRVPIPIPSYPPQDDPDQILDPRVAYVMTHLMNEVVIYGTGHDAQSLGRPAAGKTGTTTEGIDAWFLGFTPHVVTGVWVGFDNHRTIGPGETGAKAALPIWLGFMKEVVKSYPNEDFQVPPGVVFASIDPHSGKPMSPNSARAIQEAFIEGTQPIEPTDKTKATPETQSEFFKEDTE